MTTKEKIRIRISSFISYFKGTILPILLHGTFIGAFTGVLVWAFSILVEIIGEKVVEFYAYARTDVTFLPVFFSVLIGLALLSYFNVKYSPEARGSGVPYAEGVMRGLLPLKWHKSLISMLFGSLLTFVGGLPLGSEGPSVFMGSCVGWGVNAVGRRTHKSRYAWRRQSVTGGAAAGFAVAFNAPFAGIIFAMEEGHKRFSPMILLPSAASIIVATLTANILTAVTGHGIVSVVFTEFSGVADPTFREIGYLLLVGIAVGIFSVLFSVILNVINRFVAKHKIPLIIRVLFAFLLAGASGLMYIETVGAGSGLIRLLSRDSMAYTALLIILGIKLFTVTFCSSSGVTGGLFIPILAIGALFGSLMAKLMMEIGMGEQYYSMVVLVCMCAFLGGVMRAPVTAIVLVIEMTHSLISSLWATCLVILLAYFVIELFNVEPIYDTMLGNIMKQRASGKRKKLVECEVSVEEGSFAIDRCVRDILWPAGALVIKVKETDEKGHVVYRTDKGGERKIRVGDKFIVQVETDDFASVYEQLCFIIKRPDYVNEITSKSHTTHL